MVPRAMTKGFTELLKKKVITTKQDIDHKILNVASDSLKNIKSQFKKHTSLDLDKVDLNSQLARNVAIRVLEKAQEVRKNLTKEELVRVSKNTGKKVIASARESLSLNAKEKATEKNQSEDLKESKMKTNSKQDTQFKDKEFGKINTKSKIQTKSKIKKNEVKKSKSKMKLEPQLTLDFKSQVKAKTPLQSNAGNISLNNNQATSKKSKNSKKNKKS